MRSVFVDCDLEVWTCVLKCVGVLVLRFVFRKLFVCGFMITFVVAKKMLG